MPTTERNVILQMGPYGSGNTAVTMPPRMNMYYKGCMVVLDVSDADTANIYVNLYGTSIEKDPANLLQTKQIDYPLLTLGPINAPGKYVGILYPAPVNQAGLVPPIYAGGTLPSLYHADVTFDSMTSNAVLALTLEMLP